VDRDTDDRIPPDVIDDMACTADFYLPPHSSLKRELHRTLNAYELAREVPHVEPDMRARLCRLFVLALPGERSRMLTSAQCHAIEVCAEGGPFRVCEAWITQREGTHVTLDEARGRPETASWNGTREESPLDPDRR
jgi:hypothetical protein